MTLESVNAATYTISYSANGGTGDAMPNTTGTAPAVASCSFTAPEGYTFSRWNTASDGSGDDYAPGDIAASNLTLYAIWIVEIGQNITMAPGTSASNVSVVTTTSKTKDAIKCGTSKAAGDMTLTLKNSGMTKIKVYVAGWSTDSTNQTIDVSISSGTISPASITFTCDSGISGNGSTYTLDANESTYRFDFTLTNAPADAVITLAAHTAKDNRFVVWGATYMFAESFANDFLTNLSCTANGSSQPTYTNDYSWSEFSALYSSLDDEEQAILTNATANQSGTAIQQAVARYDYIVGKYNKGLGITSYTDFMHRDPSAIGVSARVILSGINVNSSAISVVVIVMSMVSLTAVGGYFFLRKRRENN